MPRLNSYRKKYADDDLYAYIDYQRAIHGMTQAELGTVTGDSQQVISRKLNNHTLTYRNIVSIFDYFDEDAETIGQILKGRWKEGRRKHKD